MPQARQLTLDEHRRHGGRDRGTGGSTSAVHPPVRDSESSSAARCSPTSMAARTTGTAWHGHLTIAGSYAPSLPRILSAAPMPGACSRSSLAAARRALASRSHCRITTAPLSIGTTHAADAGHGGRRRWGCLRRRRRKGKRSCARAGPTWCSRWAFRPVAAASPAWGRRGEDMGRRCGGVGAASRRREGSIAGRNLRRQATCSLSAAGTAGRGHGRLWPH